MTIDNAEDSSATDKEKKEYSEGDGDEEITEKITTNVSSTKIKYPENQHQEEAGKPGEGTE